MNKETQKSENQTPMDFFSEEFETFFSQDSVINTITDEQLQESKSSINKNMEIFSQELKARESQSLEESASLFIR